MYDTVWYTRSGVQEARAFMGRVGVGGHMLVRAHTGRLSRGQMRTWHEPMPLVVMAIMGTAPDAGHRVRRGPGESPVHTTRLPLAPLTVAILVVC